MSRPSGGASAAARPAAPRPAASPGAGAARPSTGAGAARPPGSAVGSGTRPGSSGAPGARPGGATPGATPGSRPNASQVNNFLDVPRAGTGAAGAGAARGGGAAADFLQQGNRPSQLPGGAGAGIAAGAAAGAAIARPGAGAANRAGAGDRAGTAADRRQNVSEARGGRIENRQEWQGNRQERASEVLDQYNDTPVRDFWSDHPVWGAAAITRPFRWASWGAMSGWCGYGTSEAAYYNYGENVYYGDDGSVYYGDQPVATAEEYANQAQAIVDSAPETPPANAEWMPLGVFALTQDGEATGSTPTMYMQLAISKEGMIGGNFNNTATSETQSLEGAIDKDTQRAAWGITGKSRPIVETGLGNLTKDSSPVLIHFADGNTQQWLMVRLPDPDAKK
jgi:hypothetical protein